MTVPARTNEPANTSQDHLIARICQAQRQVRQHLTERQTHPLLDAHITMSQLKVLIILARTGGTSAHELAEQTGTSPATLTGIVDRLVGQSLISRREDSHDRRVRRLELTAAGAELVERLIATGEELQQQLLRQLDEDALQIVAQAFDLLVEATTRGNDPPAVGRV
jgi:DNA-binding MarR family transcriptional regulator